jgi:uncharacterized membrane protein
MVGREGMFGFGLAIMALAIFQLVPNRPDDVVVAIDQLRNCTQCIVASLSFFMAVPVFNSSAVMITARGSAATRVILDTLRNIVVWVVALTVSFFHEAFSPLQLTGFLLVVCGTAIYKHTLRIPHPFFAATHADEGENDSYVVVGLPAGRFATPRSSEMENQGAEED